MHCYFNDIAAQLAEHLLCEREVVSKIESPGKYQMSTNNLCFCKEVDQSTHTDRNLKIGKLLDCSYIILCILPRELLLCSDTGFSLS